MTIYLYVKQHQKTGLKYFGKTTHNPLAYRGSGTYWQRHCNHHGWNIETIQIWEFEDQLKCTEFALKFSEENNITESDNWANLMPENGLDGHTPGAPKPNTPEQNRKIALYRTGRRDSEEHRKRKSISAQNRKKQPTVICPHCNQAGVLNGMRRYHFDNCKKINIPPIVPSIARTLPEPHPRM